MHKLLLAGAAALALVGAATSASASIVTIDFTGHSIFDEIGGTYDSLGIHFSPGAEFFPCTGGCPAPDPDGWFAYAFGSPFTVTFADPQSDVTFQVVSFSQTIADAYDAGNNLIAHVEDFESFPLSETVNHLTGAGISYIVFSGPDNGPAPTNITFDSQGGFGVPEPGVWTLMLAGFGGLGAALRRNRRAAAAIA